MLKTLPDMSTSYFPFHTQGRERCPAVIKTISAERVRYGVIYVGIYFFDTVFTKVYDV